MKNIKNTLQPKTVVTEKRILGYVRKIDRFGRISIPTELRKITGLMPNTSVEMFLTDNGIITYKFDDEE